MDNTLIFSRIDHTLLKPTATTAQIVTLCEEALQYRTASVCIPSAYVAAAHRRFPGLNICTVVGFPLGYCVTAAKVAETAAAIGDGANEIDMVITIAAMKSGAPELVAKDIAAVREASGGKVLKVIIETCYFTDDEKRLLCRVVSDSGADFIKTSTGFGPRGATLEDVALFRANLGPGVQIKAAGGVRSREDLVAFIEAGCARIGTSSAVGLLTGGSAGGAGQY